MKKQPALSNAQRALLDAVSGRFLFWWGSMFTIGTDHGYYNREREQNAKNAGATVRTVRSLIERNYLTKIGWFKADATGSVGYLYRRAEDRYIEFPRRRRA